MVFPIFPKLWNGPTALGESRAQAQVPGLSHQTTFAGNTEVRKSGDFIDVYQKKNAGFFISWGDLQKDFGWLPANYSGSPAINWWTPSRSFPQEYLRFPVVHATPTGVFATRGEPAYSLASSSAVYRAPGGRLAIVSGGASFSVGGVGTSAQPRLTEGQALQYALQLTTNAATFTTLFSIFSRADAFATSIFGNGFEQPDDVCRFGQYSAPFGAKTSAGWTIGLGWRDSVDGRTVPKYTYRDVDGVVKTSTVGLRPGAHYGSIPFITRVGPTKLFAVVAKYFDLPSNIAAGESVFEWSVSTDNGATWVPLTTYPAGTFYDPIAGQVSNFLQAQFAANVRVLPHSANEVLVYTYAVGATWRLHRVSLQPFEVLATTELRPVLVPSPDPNYQAGVFPYGDSGYSNPLRAPFYATYSGDNAPTYVVLERGHPTDASVSRVAITKDFVNVELVDLPWKAGLYGDPKWLNDTTVLMPAYDVAERSYNLYESKDNFRTWAKKAVLYNSTDNRAWAPRAAELGDPDRIRDWPELAWPNNTLASLGLMPPTIHKLDRFSTIEWLRDEQGKPAAANPFSGRWICDDSAPPPEF